MKRGFGEPGVLEGGGDEGEEGHKTHLLGKCHNDIQFLHADLEHTNNFERCLQWG